MSFFKKALHDTALYGIGTVLTRLSAVIILPFLTRIFPPETYAVIGLILVILPFTRYILMLEISQAVAVFFVDSTTEIEKKSYFSTGFNFTLIALFFLSAFFFLVYEGLVLFDKNFHSVASFSLVLVLLVAIIFDSLSYYCMNIIRWMGASKRYIINSFVVSWLNVSLILVLVGLCHFKLGGIFFSWALSWVTGFILAWLPVKQYFQLEIAKSKLKAMLKFSFPLFLNNVPSNFNSMLDRYIVLAVLGLYSLGLYSAAASTAGILSMVSAVMQLAIWPLVYQAHKLENATRKVKTMLNTGFFFVIILAVLSIFLSGFLGKIFLGRSFLHSPSVRMIITILMLNYLVATLTNFFPGMAIARRNHYLILITLIGLIINLVLGLILVKLCGISGVPIAVLIASISQVTLYGYMSQRFFPLPFTRTDFIIFLPLGILLISIPLYITLSSMHISHLFRFGVELFIGLCLVGWGLWLYCSQKSRKFN